MPAENKRNQLLAKGGLVLALLLSAVFLYLAFRGVDWKQLRQALAHANPLFIVLASSIASGGMALRALRWRVLLSAETNPPFPLVFWCVAGGYFANSVLPARAGEVLRSAAMGRSAGISNVFVLSTTLTERVIDAAVLVAVSAICSLTLPNLPPWIQDASRAMAIVSGIGLACIVLLPQIEGFLQKMLAKLPLPAALLAKLEALLAHILLGIRALHHPGRALAFGALTCIVWLTDCLGALVVAHSLGILISFTAVLILLAALGLASAIPSASGYVGIPQFVAVTVLGSFAIPQYQSLAFVLVLLGISLFVVTLWGVPAIWKLKGAARATAPKAAAVTLPE